MVCIPLALSIYVLSDTTSRLPPLLREAAAEWQAAREHVSEGGEELPAAVQFLPLLLQRRTPLPQERARLQGAPPHNHAIQVSPNICH